jgi:hypothetical protein
VKHRLRQPVRINFSVAGRVERSRGIESPDLQESTFVDPGYIEAKVTSALVFALEVTQVLLVTCQTERRPTRESTIVAKIGDQVLQFFDCPLASTIGMHSMCFADTAYQVDQGSIDFILQEARAGGGAAGADIASVHHNNVHAGAGQEITNQCARNAGADYRYLTVGPFVKWGTGEWLRAHTSPERHARSHSHLLLVTHRFSVRSR